MKIGLRIHSKSSKTYNHNYSILHQIRWLTLIYFGLPLKVKEVSTFGLYQGLYYDKLINILVADDNELTYETLNWCFKRAGHTFPNIHFHSDCSGTYTKTGKLFGNGLKTGNSKKLLKELTLLVNNNNVKKVNQDEYLYKALIEFYELVKDTVENHDGKIFFS